MLSYLPFLSRVDVLFSFSFFLLLSLVAVLVMAL